MSEPKEYYEILRDGRHFAGFVEGDDSRWPNEAMSYNVFIREFEQCRSFWESKGVESQRWTYRITSLHVPPFDSSIWNKKWRQS